MDEAANSYVAGGSSRRFNPDVHADSDATAERRVDGPPNTSADLHVDTTQEKQERWRQQHEADRVQPGQGHLRPRSRCGAD